MRIGFVVVVLLGLLAAPRMAADTPTVVNFAGFDSADSGLNSGPCLDAGSTAQSDSSGFTYNINWSCFSGQLKITGNMRVDYIPANIPLSGVSGYWSTATDVSVKMSATFTLAPGVEHGLL